MLATALVLVPLIVFDADSEPAPNFGWSPNSDRLAFVIATPTARDSLAAFPLFPDSRQGVTLAAPAEVQWTIWAVDAKGGSVLVDRGPLPRSSPSWGGDGASLVFARVIADGTDGEVAWEVVSVDAGAQVVRFREPFALESMRAAPFANQAVARSRDGRRLAVPHPDGDRFAIIDIEHAQRLGDLIEGRHPTFAPVGDRLAFDRASTGIARELVVASTSDRTSPLCVVPLNLEPVQPPRWSDDGGTLYFLDRRDLGPGEGSQVSLEALDVGSGDVTELKPIENSIMPGETFGSASFTIGPDGIVQFYRVAASGRPPVLAYHQGRMPMTRLHPFGGPSEVSAPAVSPSGEWLALRIGAGGARSVVGLYQIADESFTPIAPDDESTAAWIRALGESAEPPSPTPIRPTRLPFGSELKEGESATSTLKRIAKLGRPLVDRLQGRLGPLPEAAQAALFFEYLDRDYNAAGRSLARLIQRSTDPDRTLRLLGLRAQIALDQGREAEARAILDYVSSRDAAPAVRVEPNGNGGFAITANQSLEPPWPEAIWNHRPSASSPLDQSGTDRTHPSIPPTADDLLGDGPTSLPALPR